MLWFSKGAQKSVNLTLYASIPTKPPHQKAVEIYQFPSQNEILLSQFLIPQPFEAFDFFWRQAFLQQVVRSSHICSQKVGARPIIS